MTTVIILEVYFVGVGLIEFEEYNSPFSIVSGADEVCLAKVHRNAWSKAKVAPHVLLGLWRLRSPVDEILVEAGHQLVG